MAQTVGTDDKFCYICPTNLRSHTSTTKETNCNGHFKDFSGWKAHLIKKVEKFHMKLACQKEADIRVSFFPGRRIPGD